MEIQLERKAMHADADETKIQNAQSFRFCRVIHHKFLGEKMSARMCVCVCGKLVL